MPEIIVERRGPVALLTLNRPDVLNALSVSMAKALTESLEEMSAREDVRAIVVTGAGRAFSSGGDIAFMKGVVDKGGRFEDFQPLVAGGPGVVRAITHAPKPVLAAVNGVAAGGGMSLALACDVRWAADGARFAQSFVRIGLHPDWGALYTLPRLVGVSRALELMWTGDMVSATDAERMGLVSRVLPADRLLPEILDYADRLARGPAVAIAEIKHSMRDALHHTLEESLARELAAQERCWGTGDAKEGFRAFLEKRDPKFEGK
jgi:2-(1,2-epoxy-1,2-dihydrophenyl)acetyl-CoA isomerase